jgi:hypothetical protein
LNKYKFFQYYNPFADSPDGGLDGEPSSGEEAFDGAMEHIRTFADVVEVERAFRGEYAFSATVTVKLSGQTTESQLMEKMRKADWNYQTTTICY